jgi:hypothetical protein
MNHPERNRAKRIDSPDRCEAFTAIVYGGAAQAPADCYRGIGKSIGQFMPPANEFSLFFGDLHGHSDLSDGKVDVDTFFINQRDLAKTDFCALTDHDHGGVGKPELWQVDPVTGKSKWDITLEKCDEYNEPQRFTTIPAYERDSYPWYSNMILYYRSSKNAAMYRGVRDGEITQRELAALAGREDILFGPHTCSTVSAGTDLNGRDQRLMPKTFEIYSRSGAYEYYDNPFPSADSVCGCAYIDALENGAHPACIACTDDHMGFCGRDLPAPAKENSYAYTGLTGVYANENTREALFDALRARRCYAFMGEKRITVDFRIDGHYMGEIITGDGDKRTVWYKVDGGDVPVSRVDLIKNGRSIVFFRNAPSRLVFDYVKEREEDYYYLRIQMADGRYAWTSPIWVR